MSTLANIRLNISIYNNRMLNCGSYQFRTTIVHIQAKIGQFEYPTNQCSDIYILVPLEIHPFRYASAAPDYRDYFIKQ